ncbi:WAP four-disulfide core domain protein 1 [Molossus nigricans]
MGNSRRQVIWALCSLLLLLEASSAKNIWKRSLHEWLAKKANDDEAYDPWQTLEESCPPAPPPRFLPLGACQVALCQADSQCRAHHLCCYNGCVYTCMKAIPPPPVVDWLEEPERLWPGGKGWLLEGPRRETHDICSTTEDEEGPLLCPSGFECHILSPGDVSKGIPNHGQCVKQGSKAEESFRHTVYKEYPEGDFKNVAEHGKERQVRVQ